MKFVLNTYLPQSKQKRKWFAVSVTAFVCWLLTVLVIYGLRDYGGALFIFLPLYMGAGSALLYGYKLSPSFGEVWRIGVLTLAVYVAGLLLFAIEGAICLAMAAPLGILFTSLGSLLGYAITTHKPGQAPTAVLFLALLIPGVSFTEKKNDPELTSVVTSIEIDADPQTVWKNVIAFPQLKEPTELLFTAGIAYPTSATIKGHGIGAVRHCNFTTGSFIEPITIWDEGKLLRFNVAKHPAPLKELSFWNIDAPHLHDFFVSKQGQFKLIKLPNGKIRLEGTTWYCHNIRPAFYWQSWSNYIIHKIHERVLKHIKENAEAAAIRN